MNRFNQPAQLASYKPLSFQELAFAPIQLRQREDNLNNQKDEILTQMNNIVGYEGFDEETNQMKAGMKQKLEDLASKIQKNGAGNVNYMNEFRNLRNEYNGLTSATGALGMSSALRANMDSQKQAFYKMAIENGQSPADIDRNWQEQIELYKQQLPSSISKHKGQLPSMNIMMPPKHQDLADHAAKLHNMMGSINEKWGKPRFETVTDPETGETSQIIWSESGENITNKPQVKAMMGIINMDILNPNSAIAQDMRFKGMTPEDYLQKVDLLGALVTKEGKSRVTDYKGTMGGNSGKKASDTDAPEVGEATLTRADNSAIEKVDNSQTIESIDGAIKSLKLNEAGLTEKEQNQQLNALRHARIKKLKEEESPEFINKMNEEIKANHRALEPLGIKSWNDYLNLRNQTGENVEMTQVRSTDHNIFGALNTVTNTPKKDVAAKTMNKIYEKLQSSNPVLANSEQYTLGSGKTDIELNTMLSKSFPQHQLRSLLAGGQVELYNSDLSDEMYNKVEPNSDEHQKLISAINTGDVKFTFGAINSGSEMAGPEMLFTMETGSGKDKKVHQISLDLKESGYGQELLDSDSDFYKGLDPKGRATVDAIRDNMAYAGLSTHMLGVDRGAEIYNDNSSKNIKALAKKRTDEQFQYSIKNTKDPNDLDEMFLNSQFIKDDGNQYAVRINSDGSYTTYKTEPGSGREIAYTFEDYINKETMAEYAKKHVKKPDTYNYELLTSPEGQKWQDDMKVIALNRIVDVTGDINQLENSLIIYNKSAGFMESVQEWYQIRHSNMPEAQKTAKALEIYNKIKSYPLQTKRKKMAL